MALQVTVRNGAGVVTDITARVRLPGPDDDVGLQLGTRAFQCESGQSSLVIDDDDGEYGNSEGLPGGLTALSIAAHNVVTVSETATTPATVLLRGRVIPKEIGRGDHDFGRSRQLTLRLDDYNADLKGLAFLQDYDRPAETDVARATWVLTTFLSGSPRATTNLTNGIVAGNTVTMPAKTYEAGTQPFEVLNECAIAAEKEVFVMADGTLYYAVPTDTSKVAGIRISDRESEINTDASCVASAPSLVSHSGFTTSSSATYVVPTGLVESAFVVLTFWREDDPATAVAPTWTAPGFAAQTFTEISTAAVVNTNSTGLDPRIRGWYLLNPNPAPDTNNPGTLTKGGWAGIYLLEYVHQTSPVLEVNTQSTSGTTTEASVGVNSGTIVNAAGAWDEVGSGTAPIAGGGQTPITSQVFDGPGGDMEFGTGYGSRTPTWTFASSRNYVAAVVAVNSSSGGSSPPTFPPIPVGPASTEDGQGLLSGGVLRHQDGFVSETRASVASAYDYWVETINDTGAVTAADASARLNAILDVFQYEHRTYKVAVQLHRTQVGCVKAGQLIDIKWRAIPDADDQYRSRRIAALEWQWAGPEHWLAVMELDKPIRISAHPGAGPVAAAALVAKRAEHQATDFRWEPVVWNGETVFWNGDIVVHKVAI